MHEFWKTHKILPSDLQVDAYVESVESLNSQQWYLKAQIPMVFSKACDVSDEEAIMAVIANERCWRGDCSQLWRTRAIRNGSERAELVWARQGKARRAC